MNFPFTFNKDASQLDFATEVPVRAFEPLRPYPQNPQAIVYRTRFAQLRAYYTRPIGNTPHPDLPQVYFLDDVDYQDRPGGMIEWTRAWATLPNSWIDFESSAFTFPGFVYNIFAGFPARAPLPRTVSQKIQNDYFLVGSLPTFSTNIVNGDDFNNASWTKTGTNSTANAVAVPVCANGAVVAAQLTEDSSTGLHGAYQASNAGAGAVAGAAFVKAGTRKKVKVGIGPAAGSGTWADVSVDLTTGAWTPNGQTNFAVSAVGEGWWRIDIAGTAPNANAALLVLLENNAGNSSYAGDGASYLFAWRGQLVPGAAIPHATVPPATTPDGAYYPVQAADFIPTKFGTRFVYNSSLAVANYVVEYVSPITSPNINTYNQWIATDNGNVDSFSIESTDSVLSLWQGTIWDRQRRFVKAI